MARKLFTHALTDQIEQVDLMLFKGFTSTRISTGEVEINVKYAGSGPAVLLLHGYPQTHHMWHHLAPRLVEQHYTVVVTDLRGYGDSSHPIGLSDHSNYSKRVMAADQIKVMQQLGFDRFHLVSHDRGSRVSYRFIKDYPEHVISCTLMDIIPTYDQFHLINKDTARAYYHWFFLTQPFDFPERLIGSNPEFCIRNMLQGLGKNPDVFDEQAVAQYIRCFMKAGVIHSTCEDYRAAASIDLEHDSVDRNTPIKTPLQVLWGASGMVGKSYDVLNIWRQRAPHVIGEALPCGHFLPEEAPDETYNAVISFMKKFD